MKKQPNMRHIESNAVLGYGGLIVLRIIVVLPVALSYMTVSSTREYQGFSIVEFTWS